MRIEHIRALQEQFPYQRIITFSLVWVMIVELAYLSWMTRTMKILFRELFFIMYIEEPSQTYQTMLRAYRAHTSSARAISLSKDNVLLSVGYDRIVSLFVMDDKIYENSF